MKKGMIIGLSLIGLIIPVGLQAIEDKEDRIETVITFNLTAEDRFTYEVRVSEGGYLIDGSQRITNGIMEYQLSVGQTKEFSLEADRGYEVKEIQVNEEKIDREVDKIEIAGVSKKSILEVRYGKIEETTVPDIPTPPDEGDNSDTPISPDKGGNKDSIDMPEQITSEGGNKGNRIEGMIPITADMLRIREYVCLMLIVIYMIYVSRRDIFMQGHVDNKEK